ncbi:hypothetical protein PO909_026831 [Leuciscus waleckii]
MLLDPDLIIRQKDLKKCQKKKLDLYKNTVAFTDGSKTTADEEAHWAFILKQSNKVIDTGKGVVQGTAQYAELMAAFQALKALQKLGILQAVLVTDSSYVATGINDNLHIWKENGYSKSKGRPIEHATLWQDIQKIIGDFDLTVIHQPGHSKEDCALAIGNNEVDKLARLRRIVIIKDTEKNVIQKIHDQLKHPSVNLVGYNRTIRSDFGSITPDSVNQEWSLDIAGPLIPRSKAGNKYILVAVDGFTGRIWGKPLKETKANAIIAAVNDLLIAWGRPQRIRVDNGTYFVGKQFEDFVTEKHISLIKSVRYCPQSNGIAERSVGIIKSWIRANCNHERWDDNMEELMFYVNLTEIKRPTTSKDQPEDSCNECRISFPKIEVIMTQRLGDRQTVCDCSWTGNKWIKCQICLDDITNRRLLVYSRHRIWSWNKTFCDLTSKGKIESSGLSIDNTNYQQQLGNSGVDYLWSYRIKRNMDDIQSKWLLVDPRALGPELGSLKTCFDDKGRTFQPDNGTGIIWSIGTIAKTLLESNIGEQIMAPRLDFPRRGECDETNGYMRCQFGQLDEERCPNKIILKRSKVLCVPIAFWRQNSQQAGIMQLQDGDEREKWARTIQRWRKPCLPRPCLTVLLVTGVVILTGIWPIIDFTTKLIVVDEITVKEVSNCTIVTKFFSGPCERKTLESKKWQCGNNYMARAGMTWQQENKNKHWLAFWRNARGQTWQGLRIAMMIKHSDLWNNVITENGTETDQMEVLTIDRSLWTVYYFEGRKTFLYPGWGYLNMSLDSNLRRLDINQGINRMLAYEVTSYKPIYMDNKENYAGEDRGRCMPPYPLYWVIARLQYTNLHAGYRQWTTQDWKHFGGKVLQGWKIVGKKAKETIETVINMGQNIVSNTFGAIKWIIDNWYVILIVGAFIGILILLELTGLGGLLRGLIKGLCCTTVNGIMQVAGTDKEDKQVLIEKKMRRKTLTERNTSLVRGVTRV